MTLISKLSAIKNNLHEIARREISILLVSLIIIVFSLLFLEIGDEVGEGSTQKFDETVLSALRDMNLPYWFSELMRDITALGGGTIIAFFTLAVIGFLVLQKEYNAMWLVLAAVIGGALLSFLLKEIYSRERPVIVEHLMVVTSFSFPSGHSMMSAVAYLTLGALLARIQKKKIVRIYILIIAMLLTFLIGISRIYLGVHYPTDVLGGWSVGLVWASLCWFAAWFLQRKHKLEKAPDNK